MRVQIQLRILDDADIVISDDEVFHLDRGDDHPEMVGLSLDEAKCLVAGIQEHVIVAQAACHIARHRCCATCGRRLRNKGLKRIVFRTAFGNIPLDSPRFYHCRHCWPAARQKTFSPLTQLFPEHVAPELLYLEAKWASLVSYGMTLDLLKDVLPIGRTANASTIRNHLHKVARRGEAELGNEQPCFIEGCPADWKALPMPEGPIVVGIDGGYVRSWDDKKTNFELIVGKSVPEDRDDRYFGFVQTLDDRPKRRLYEILRSQGMQMNQDLVFLTDGGDDVRELANDMSPCAEHYLDWFHITMRLTVLTQYVKGLAHHASKDAEAIQTCLERIKWRLWHGDGHEALSRVEDLSEELDSLECDYPFLDKFARAAMEFATYIRHNAGSIPNYGERWRNHERISTAFVESTVNVVVGKRFAKKQQMQWSKEGAHLLLQTRTQALDGTLHDTFTKWYPAMAANDQTQNPSSAAAA